MKAVRLGSKASDIKFKHVGNRVVSKTTRRSVMSVPEIGIQQEGRFPDEIDPHQMQDQDWRQYIDINVSTSSLMENTRVSRFTHHQLLLIQKNILVLALLTIFLGMIKIEADYLFPSGTVSDSLMMVISSTTCMLVVLVIMRKMVYLQLQVDQHRVYSRKDDKNKCRTLICKIISDKYILGGLIVEILTILPHPVQFLQGIQYSSLDQNQSLTFIYQINDVLNVLMMAKIYLVFRSLVAMSIYSSPRAVRLCTYNNIDHTWFYSLKCIQQEYPLAFTTVISLVFMFIFGIGFRVTEGNLYYLNRNVLSNKTGFQDYSTCLWFTFITMTSIGYGEYSPITPMGRILAGFIAIFGVILNSFLVVALTQYLRMKTGEIRSHTTTSRLREQKNLFGKSAGILAQTITTTQMIAQQKYDPSIINKLKPVFQDLKGRIQQTKAYNRHIKSILPNPIKHS